MVSWPDHPRHCTTDKHTEGDIMFNVIKHYQLLTSTKPSCWNYCRTECSKQGPCD